MVIKFVAEPHGTGNHGVFMSDGKLDPKGNAMALCRNWRSADRAELKVFGDCATFFLFWEDGAWVSRCEDSAEDAISALNSLGWYPSRLLTQA